MKRLLVTLRLSSVLLAIGSLGTGRAASAQEGAPLGNGDVNGDGRIDISDPVYLLTTLFLGGPKPRPIGCAAPVGDLPATGQTRCHDAAGAEIQCSKPAWVGQDGYYQAGCPTGGRFTDNGDGTVTDKCTGLLWQKLTAPGTHTWKNALKYCDALELGGHSDWRLPNIRELQSIVDHGRFSPAIDPAFRAVSEPYWSSTSSVDFPQAAWHVSFVHGGCSIDVKTEPSRYVRAVRGGTELGLPATGQTRCPGAGASGDCASADFPGQDGFYQSGCPRQLRFRDNGDGTVTDACTGLMWTSTPRDIDGNGRIGAEDQVNWQDAIQHCEGLLLAGHSDWRLPNLLELQSLMEYGESDATIAPVFWASVTAWSSTSQLRDPRYAWTGNWFVDKTARREVLAVRSTR